MTLADLRKLAVRKQVKIRFPIANGMECVVNERGVAQVPALHAAPGFNLETELAAVTRFQIESVPAKDAKTAPKPQTVSREELAAMAHAPAAAADHEHDEEE